MRRSVAWALALALSCGGLAACGDDGGGDDGAAAPTSTTATTTTATVTTTPADLTTQVDEFCAGTEEMEAVIRRIGSGPVSAEARADGQEQLSTIASRVLPLKMGLDPAVGQMDPEDAARYQECGAILGDVEGAPG